MNRLILAFLTLLACVVSLSDNSAFAVVLEDFEGSYGGPGTLVVDPADAGNQVLKLVSNRGVLGTDAEIFAIDTNGFVGKVTMDIYDFGATTWDDPTIFPFPMTPGNGGTDHGPRWGIQGDSNSDGTLDNWVAAGIMQKTFLSSNKGYSFIHDNIADDGQRAFSFNGDWFSPNFFGDPRRVKTDPTGVAPSQGDGLQYIVNGTPEVPDVPGAGAWTTWEFDISAAGNVSITALAGTTDKFLDSPYATDTQSQYNTFAPNLPVDMTIENMKQIWVTGGQSDVEAIGKLGSILGTHGVLVDNITFDGVTASNPDGDFNDNGIVDAADYAVWLDNVGAASLPNDGGLGVVGSSHYDLWKTNFGSTSGIGTGNGAAIPEPGCLLLLACAAICLTVYRNPANR